MNIKKNMFDKYYEHVEKDLCCDTYDELLGKKYVIAEKIGVGSFLRMKIEEGLEISNMDFETEVEMNYDSSEDNEDILEVGYCYEGSITITSFPDNKDYSINKGDIFIYRTLNSIESFKFISKSCRVLSIHLNFNMMQNNMNPTWEGRLMGEWQGSIHHIFKEKMLIIEKASYDIKTIAEQIDKNNGDCMIGYMKLKLHTIDFLTTFLEEKSLDNLLGLANEEIEMVKKAKDIIKKNLESPPTVNELAHYLNKSVYKLQKGFKHVAGTTVYEYIKQARVERAKYLLKNTDMSILQIANDIGYDNPSKFSHSFKQYNHLTPSEFRKIIVNK